MSEQTAAFRKVFEYSLLEAEGAVKYYRSLLGLPPVGSSTDCAKEIESLKGQLQEKTKELDSLKRCTAQQKSENEILRGKVNDLDHKLRQACQERDKLSQACQERDKLAEKLYRAEVEVQRYGLFLKKLSHLIYEETRC